MSAKKPRVASGHCLCGRPSVGAGRRVSGGAHFYQSACERCLEIESSLHPARSKRAGSNRLSDGLRRTCGQGDSFNDVRRAAHKWLKARGLDTAVSMTFVEYIL